ncbi:NAD-dependent protein deacylase Sirt4 [Drosophila grimshawi]|uniref:NAD-dependent protein deacylase n=1 Tax=Drosophila grimshawi TaxID=7222 RepID=B4JKI2_DROGR|nr:NAD-dependent protein deacylase Sirt4 [Drosophila grimshawi]XP_032594204.1 NAD-dependent protein deacylase Sirt4 [Drosophila grimshawi]EDW00085.1 GH12046 [Drosophila grimshawi]
MRLGGVLRCHRVIRQQYVPQHKPVLEDDIKRLEDFLLSKPNILVLTGAGISTESGIPDYRSAGVGLYARTNHKPIQHSEFVKSASVRKRYWARNFVGWPNFSSTQPNSSHHALARFEREIRLQSVVTQNVDRLHTKAGTKSVIEVHGSGYVVKCLSCDYRCDRHEFQSILATLNPMFKDAPDMIRPDGDVEIPLDYIENFHIPPCPQCGGHLKPEIVFFGDSVPKDRLETIARMVYTSDGLLVLGSSLLVFSGYRIVLQTKDLKLPVAIVNIGETRADHLADIKISAKCGDVIPKLFDFSNREA